VTAESGISVRDHDHRLLQESAHAFFPRESIHHFAAQVLIPCAGGSQVGFAFRRRLRPGGRQYLHHPFIDPFIFFRLLVMAPQSVVRRAIGEPGTTPAA
jgi:hypothetical protein